MIENSKEKNSEKQYSYFRNCCISYWQSKKKLNQLREKGFDKRSIHHTRYVDMLEQQTEFVDNTLEMVRDKDPMFADVIKGNLVYGLAVYMFNPVAISDRNVLRARLEKSFPGSGHITIGKEEVDDAWQIIMNVNISKRQLIWKFPLKKWKEIDNGILCNAIQASLPAGWRPQ